MQWILETKPLFSFVFFIFVFMIFVVYPTRSYLCVRKAERVKRGEGVFGFLSDTNSTFSRLLEISNAIWWYPLTVIPPQSHSEKYCTPLKIYMETKNGGLEDDFPIQLGDF